MNIANENYVQLVASARAHQKDPDSNSDIKQVVETPQGLSITKTNGVKVTVEPKLVGQVDSFIKDAGGEVKPKLNKPTQEFDAKKTNESGSSILDILRELMREISKQRGELQQALDSSKIDMMMMEYNTGMKQADMQVASTWVKGAVGIAASSTTMVMQACDFKKMQSINKKIEGQQAEALKIASDPNISDSDKKIKLADCANKEKNLERQHQNIWARQTPIKMAAETLQSIGSSVGGQMDAESTRLQAQQSFQQATRSMLDNTQQYIVSQSTEAQRAIESSAAAYNQVLQQWGQARV